MKHKLLFVTISFFLYSSFAFSQDVKTIYVNTKDNVTLSFISPIVQASSSGSFTVDYDFDQPNIGVVKGLKDIKEDDAILLVETEDGLYYSIVVSYKKNLNKRKYKILAKDAMNYNEVRMHTKKSVSKKDELEKNSVQARQKMEQEAAARKAALAQLEKERAAREAAERARIKAEQEAAAQKAALAQLKKERAAREAAEQARKKAEQEAAARKAALAQLEKERAAREAAEQARIKAEQEAAAQKAAIAQLKKERAAREAAERARKKAEQEAAAKKDIVAQQKKELQTNKTGKESIENIKNTPIVQKNSQQRMLNNSKEKADSLLCMKIINLPNYYARLSSVFKRKNYSKHDLGFHLMNVLSKGDKLYFYFEVINRSNFIKRINNITYTIVDKKDINKDSTNAQKILPVYVFNMPKQINGGKTHRFVAVFKWSKLDKNKVFKADITDSKKLKLTIIATSKQVNNPNKLNL